MNWKKTLIILLAVLGGKSWAQQDLTLYFMDNITQVSYTNPSTRPMGTVNIGLPGISSVYGNTMNTIFTPKDVFDVGDDGVPTLRVDHLKKMWKKRNYIGAHVEVDLLSFGFAAKKNYFSFNATENVFFRATLPGDMLRFPFTGNANFDQLENGTLDFSNFRIDFNHYREYSFGMYRQWNEKLEVGAKLKYLYGMENIHTKTSDITWRTDEEEFDWHLNGQLVVNTSGVYPLLDSIDGNSELENEEYVDYLLKKKNHGLAIDLGGTYTLSERLKVSASLIDLGFIRWNDNNRNLRSNKAEFIFTGIDFSDAVFVPDSLMADTIESITNDLIDEVANTYGVEDNTDKYANMLVSRFYLGATYEHYNKDNKSNTIGALIHGEIYHGKIRPSLTVSYSYQLSKHLQTTLSYSLVNRDYKNVGFGMSLNLGPLQAYAVADNVLAGVMSNLTYTESGAISPSTDILYPYYSKNIHVRAGVNLTFGRDPDKDGDGIKNKVDKCPEIPGLAVFDGCPDTDNDSIPDNVDACPRVPGVKEFDGCPDTDKDGIQDKVDDCPEIPGVAEFNGCPDTDKDGIKDEEDECPEVPGIAEFNGCPDTDGDGLKDSEDDCPELAGPLKYNGCPDTDGDGLFDPNDGCPTEAGPFENRGCPWGDSDSDGLNDNEDKCPYVAGPVDNQGCPIDDTDKDGVPDKVDRCPTVPGIPENQGCPEIKKEEQEILNTAFENLEFKSGKAIIKEVSYASLNDLAELLIKKPDWRLEISGHTDNVGSSSSNLYLSKKRSQAVASYLESRGVNSSRFIVKWFGEDKPIADNKTEEGRQRNRRVEMTIVFE